MKIQVGVETGTSYTFHAKDAGPAALMISGIDVKKDNVLAVINMTKGVVAMKCNFVTPEYAIFPETNIIELYSTLSDSFEATDKFMILMEVASRFQDQALLEIIGILSQLRNVTESLGNVDSSNRQKVYIDHTPNVYVSGTAGAGITGIGYPCNVACTAGGANPYAITAAQPIQLTAQVIDQRIGLEIDFNIAAATGIYPFISWT